MCTWRSTAAARPTTKAHLDEVFEAPNGPILEAHDEFDDALKAADEALMEAQIAPAEALAAAEGAKKVGDQETRDDSRPLNTRTPRAFLARRKPVV